MNTHSCGARWTGMQAAHCCECHRTFSSDSAWERHRTRADAEGRRHCADPATIERLELVEKPWGTLWQARDPKSADRIRSRRAQMGHARSVTVPSTDEHAVLDDRDGCSDPKPSTVAGDGSL